MSGFEPGQLIECIDDSVSDYGPVPFRRGRIYTVKKMSDLGRDVRGEFGVVLQGVPPPLRFSIIGWRTSRFRPLPDERLNIFRKALEPTPEQVEAYGIECLEEAEKDVEEALQAIDRYGVGSS